MAIKTESIKTDYPMIIYEANVTLILQGLNQKYDASLKQHHMDESLQVIDGFAKIHSYGQEDQVYFMTMDLMGPSLADLYQFCGYRFSLKTTLMLAVQLIDRFKYMHKKNFIHRDVKPDNFLMGMGEKSNSLHIVDMGLAKKYIDPSTKQHIAFRNDKSLTGTARYASIHAHLGEELSRRDDFEAIGYVLIYLFTGYLPW